MKKVLLLIPVTLLLISVGYLIYTSLGTGLNLDIDFTGGTEIDIQLNSAVNIQDIENILNEYKTSVRQTRSIDSWSLIIRTDPDTNANDIINKLKVSNYNFQDYSIRTIGPILGASFFTQSQIALIIAFIFMAITVFIIFRNPIPSLYVFICAVIDIIEALAFSQIFGISLSLATFTALLLLVGYSVDTDILLTTRVLKRREGETDVKIKNARTTGLTMTITTLAALTVLLVTFSSTIIFQIASVLIIGLLCDIVNTWIINVELLKWYMKGK